MEMTNAAMYTLQLYYSTISIWAVYILHPAGHLPPQEVLAYPPEPLRNHPW
jgi:hypothetical protein